MIIYSTSDEILLEVQVDDDSYRFREMMSKDELFLKFALTDHYEIPLGSYVMYGGTKYELLAPESVVIQHRRDFEYSVTFEGPQAKLRKFRLYNPVDGRLKFDYTAKAEEQLQLIIDNLNNRYGTVGGQRAWQIGGCIDTNDKLISYNHTTLQDALSSIADTYETEWEVYSIEGVSYIVVGRIEYFEDNPLVLSYGKNNGFVSGVSRVNFDDRIPVKRIYIQGGERNIDRSQYPSWADSDQKSSTLRLPHDFSFSFDGEHFNDEEDYVTSKGVAMETDGYGHSVKLSAAEDDCNEDSLDLSEVYPKRVGSATSVLFWDSRNKQYVTYSPSWTDTDWETIEVDIVDTSIPSTLNYSDYLIEGETMTIVFQSGMLTGREFDVAYRHETISGRPARRFEIVKADMDGVSMPSGVYLPAVGDEYAIFNVMLPGAYLNSRTKRSGTDYYDYEGAEWDALREAAKYLYDNCKPRYTFKGSMDAMFAKRNWDGISYRIVVGSFVSFTDESVQPDPFMVRILSVKDFINSPHTPTIELCNDTGALRGGVMSALREVETQSAHTDAQHNDAIRYTKRRWRDLEETTEMLQAALDNYTDAISPILVETMHLIAGDESLQFRFVTSKTVPVVDSSFAVTYSGLTRTVTISGGLSGGATILQHMTLGISSLSNSHAVSEYKFWDMPKKTQELQDTEKSYYIYAKVNKTGTTGTFVLSETPIGMEEQTGYYNLLLGVLNSEYEGERSFASVYGFTEVLPGRVVTDTIVDTTGVNFFDLAGGRFHVGTANNSSYIDFNNLASNQVRILGQIQAGSTGLTNFAEYEDLLGLIPDVDYLRAATNNGTTTVDGGLILSNIIALGKTEGQQFSIYAGLNGWRDTTKYGNGIAAWFGGPMGDKDAGDTSWAKSLFRFDGSGYLASGNIGWGDDGDGYIPGIRWEDGSVFIEGSVKLVSASGDQVTDLVNGVRTILSWFEEATTTVSGSTIKYLKLKTSSGGIQGLATSGFISAGGVSSGSGGGGGGGVTPSAMWDLLAANTSEQISITHLTTALSGYQPLDADLTSIAGLSGTSGLLKKTAANNWALDTTAYLTSHQTLYTLTLKVGSATVGTFTPSANATLTITASDLTTAIGNSTYLKLSGGTMTGDIKMTDGEYIQTTGGNTIIGHTTNSNNGLIYIGDAQNDTTITLSASGDLVHDTGGNYETIYDSGNLTQSVITTLIGSTTYAPYNSAGYLPLSGGVMSGPISAITYLTVNAAAQTSYRFKVNGTSNLGGNTSITGTLTVGTTTTNKATTLNGTLSVTGASTLTGLLTADGGITVPSGKSITLGSGVLEWDSDNSAWKLTGNFYATGWVSAGGVSSTGGGGGGGGINLEAMWSNLQTNASGTTGYNLQIDYHHLPTIEYSGTGFIKSAAYRKSGNTNYITFTRSGLAASDIPDLSSTYVTVATAQTITAQHTFSNGLKLSTATSWTSGDRALYFGTTTDDSNIRYYYTDSSKGLTYSPASGALKAGSFVKRSNSGGFLKADGTEDTTSYLPLAGGTMTGDIVMTNGEYINASNGYAMLGLNSAGTDFFCGPGYTVSNSFLIRSANINLTHRKHTAASTYTDYIIYDASNLTQSVVTGLIGNSTYAPYVSGGYLPLSGGTMTGSPILTNAIYLRSNDTGGTARAIIGLNSDNQLLVGYGTAGQGDETHLYGGSIEFHYGSARTTGLTLNSSGQLVKANDTPYAAYDTGGTVRTLMSLNASNIVWIAYGTAGAGYNTNLCGNQIEFKYGTSRTTGFTLDSSGNCTAAGYIAVGTGGASGSKIASDTASNIYLANSSGAVLVCASKVVRRGTSLADVSLGNSSYPWGGIYSTTGDFSDVVTMANTKAIQWLNTSNTAVSAMYLSSSNNLIIGYGLIAGGGNAYLYGTNIHLRYGSSSTGFLMDSSGKVGIGFSDNTNMYRKFNVSGDMLIRGTASATPGRLVIGNGTHNATGGAGEILFQEYALASEDASGARNGFKIAATHATSADRNDLKFYCSNVGTSPYAPSWTALMTLRYTSRVGILNETPSYTLDVTGTIHSTVGIFSDGYVSAGGVSSSSDARLKTDLKDIDLSVDQIADAPAITFKWKNETTSPRHAGSLAQYWEKVMPEVVSEVANHLTLDYGATALLSSITIAKTVKNHEERIKELEEENKQLKAKVYALG